MSLSVLCLLAPALLLSLSRRLLPSEDISGENPLEALELLLEEEDVLLMMLRLSLSLLGGSKRRRSRSSISARALKRRKIHFFAKTDQKRVPTY